MYTVKAHFESRDDAQAMVELLREMGYLCEVTSTMVNKAAGRVSMDSALVKIVLETMGDNTHYRDIGHAIEERGLSAHSVGGTLTFLVREGLVLRLGKGYYRKVR